MRIQTEFVGFRAKQQHQRKLESLAKDTGLTVSDVLRQLVESADAKPVTILRPFGVLPIRDNGDTGQNASATNKASNAVNVSEASGMFA